MRSIGPGLVFAAIMGLLPVTASADERMQSSFTSLVAKGFEVKSVTLIPLDVAKRVTEKVKTDNVIVTLQNREAVAVCYVAFANWAFMNKTSLDSSTLCEVRSAATQESAAAPSSAPSTTSSTEPPAATTPSTSEEPPAATPSPSAPASGTAP
ncbi:hypothetical protein [Hyphomicrobium sp. 99]|uniref:hypothetical protein n=1 Tax=Hyphomicrobium sp. 99 TaxID=1163419 RepID=UPI0005F864D6|nr:hypothetical protein [Hyphomicrobium sp. 99]